jgi:hypothetical protein
MPNISIAVCDEDGCQLLDDDDDDDKLNTWKSVSCWGTRFKFVGLGV